MPRLRPWRSISAVLASRWTVETDEFGFSYVDFESEDEALFAAMDDFYRQLFSDEVAA